MKCSVDAALLKDGRFGFGLCIRNDESEFEKAKTLCYTSTPDLREAEAMGLLEAVKWL